MRPKVSEATIFDAAGGLQIAGLLVLHHALFLLLVNMLLIPIPRCACAEINLIATRQDIEKMTILYHNFMTL